MQVSSYLPIRGEVELSVLHQQTQAQIVPIQCALPVCAQNEQLIFAKWTPDDPVHMGRYNIPVPVIIEPVQVQALLIPCVGVHHAGARLGYGGGWFDRTLAAYQTITTPLKLGVAFECQLNDDWTPEPHDQLLDAVITEAGVRWFSDPSS